MMTNYFDFCLALFVIGSVLSPVSGIVCLSCFGIYYFFFRRRWKLDQAVIKILIFLGILMMLLAFFFTGVPHVFVKLLDLFDAVFNRSLSQDLVSRTLFSWVFYFFDFWSWSLCIFGLAGFVKRAIGYRETMINREADRLAKRFADDYTPDFLDDKHQLVLGTTGSGKTSYLNDLSVATTGRTDIRQADLLIVIDGKADTGKHSLLDNAKKIAKVSGRELVILNGTNNPRYDGRIYNPFLGCDINQAKDLMLSLLDDDTVKKSSGTQHYRTMFEAYLVSVLEAMTIVELKFSFKNIMECLNFDKMKADWLGFRDSMDLSAQDFERFNTLYNDISNNWKDSRASVTKLDIFRRGRGKDIFEGSTDKWFNVSSVIKDNQLLVVLIDEMSMPEYAQGLAKMVVQDVRNSVSKRLDGQQSRGQRVRLVLDEFSAYASKTMLTLLSRSRSAGVTVYLSTQSMGDLSALGQDFRQAVVDNINRFVVFRQNSPESAELVANIIGTRHTVTQTERTSGGLETDEASNTLSREYLVNPDEIKLLPSHTAFYVSKDEGKVYRFTNNWAKTPKKTGKFLGNFLN